MANETNNSDGIAPKGALNQRALLVDLNISTWHAGKKDDAVSKKVIKEHNASENSGNFNKKLLPFECHEYNAIRQAERDARAFHWEQTAPWIDGGIRILTGANFLNYMEGMREKKTTFDAAVSEFIPLYPSLLERAAKPKPEGLGDMFKLADYPEIGILQAKFAFRVKRMPIPTGADFRLGLSADQIEMLRAEYEADMRENEEKAMREVWDRLYTVVKKASDDLGDKKKSVHKALFENAEEICTILPRINISGDPRLNEMIAEVQKNLASADPGIIRKSKKARSGVAADVARIEEQMRAIMQPMGTP